MRMKLVKLKAESREIKSGVEVKGERNCWVNPEYVQSIHITKNGDKDFYTVRMKDNFSIYRVLDISPLVSYAKTSP